jgi:hypothetical protein
MFGDKKKFSKKATAFSSIIHGTAQKKEFGGHMLLLNYIAECQFSKDA